MFIAITPPSTTFAAVALVEFGRTDSQWVVGRSQSDLESLISKIAAERGSAKVVIQCNDPGWVSAYGDSENGARGYACGIEAVEDAQNAARQECYRDGGRQGYCIRGFSRYDDGTYQMEVSEADPIDELLDISTVRAATRLVRAATLAEACSTITDGEVGVPALVIDTYYTEALSEFANQFGESVSEIVDVDTITAATRSEAEILLQQADRDSWPPLCDFALDGLVAASAGDFSGLNSSLDAQ